MPRYRYQRRARFWTSLLSTILQLIAVGVLGFWILPRIGVDIPWYVVVAVLFVMAAWDVFTYVAGSRALDKIPVSGKEALVGRIAHIASPLRPHGMVRIDGELWPAASLDGDIEMGDVEVVGVDRMKLLVRRAGKGQNSGATNKTARS